ncbi:fungal-specific transcription factor domain-containing protein [Verticillium dahliae]|nr:fungal-specific transcription factor domain-containing protein [Verticillium dahliae]
MDSDKQLDSAKASSIEVRTTTDRVDHASEKPERRLSHSTDASKNSGKKTAEKRADDRASPDAAEQPAKKMKRGKYISRACTSCQQRKVKVSRTSCTHIRRVLLLNSSKVRWRRAVCSMYRPGPAVRLRAKRPPFAYSDGSAKPHFQCRRDRCRTTAGNASTMELLARLAEVEHRLNMIPTSNFDAMLYKSQSHHTKGHSTAGEDHQISSTTDLSNVMEPDGQTFAGEISMSPGLQGMEDDMDRMAADSSGMMAEYPSRSPNPAGDSSPRKIRAWLEAILDQHGVVADEEAWRRYLHVFLEEIHILYPILHAPTLWETFNEMWEYSALWPLTSSAEREQKRMAVALVCFCLALGRCSVSSRVTDANGVQSAGWTLYSVGMSLLQDSTEMSNTAAKSLLTLQMLLIRVIYLFRLDATQRATRLLALAVSNAHIIGLHRQSTLENMPAVASQMYTRSWWSIYVLDRRLAIESGRPYLIQDSNVDTALPLDLSDAWLTRFQSRPEKISQLQREVALELASEPITAIPYIAAMVRYSRVVGKAWELLYGVKSANSTSSPMVEYADTVLTDLLDTLPPCLTYDPNIPNEVQFASRLRWQVKQTVLLYTCTHFLRLLMRRPFSSHLRRFDRAEDDEVECATVCASLAARILNVHESIQDDTLKYCFPFSHYLTSSTMIMMGLFTREPSLKRRHRATVLAATRSLNTYCHRIWVSGKMMRWVQKLTSLVQRTFKEGRTDRESSQRRDSVSLNQEVRGDDMQQLTPHSDQAIESENGISADFQQTRLLGGLPAGKQGLGGSPSWSFGTDGQGPNLPDWAMSDFNFETIIAGEGTVQRALQPGDLVTIPENGSSTMKISNIDLDECMFGSLGPNGIFNLDMDMEQATLGLFSPDISRYA